MNLLSVTTRELRAEARRPFNYWVRCLSAGAAIAVLIAMHPEGPNSVNLDGGDLFAALNLAILFLICVFGPMMVADCISRERREGTLPLLFLTPLKASGVILAKALAHGLRTTTLWLAILPVVCVPFLLGGVTWRDPAISFLINLGILFLALASGIVGSSYASQFRWAGLVSLLAFVVLLLLAAHLFVYFLAVASVIPNTLAFRQIELGYFMNYALPLLTGVGDVRANLTAAGATAGAKVSLLAASGCFTLGCAALSGTALALAAARLKYSWRLQPASAFKLRWIERMTRPRLWKPSHRKSLERALRRNPIGWLQYHSTGGRVSKWLWLSLSVVVPLSIFLWRAGFLFFAILLTLALGLAFSAAGSFRTERENGVLELLLITPLTPRQIIWGRLKGIWEQFFPAMLPLALAYSLVLASMPSEEHSTMALFIIAHVSTFLALAPIGLFFSLRAKTFKTAWALTCLLGLLAPAALGTIADDRAYYLLSNLTDGDLEFFLIDVMYRNLHFSFPIFQMAFAAAALWLTGRNLTRRRFVLDRP